MTDDPCDVPTDYTDPDTICLDVVIGEIRNAFHRRGDQWTEALTWPNVTVLALANEILRLREQIPGSPEARWAGATFADEEASLRDRALELSVRSLAGDTRVRAVIIQNRADEFARYLRGERIT